MRETIQSLFRFISFHYLLYRERWIDRTVYIPRGKLNLKFDVSFAKFMSRNRIEILEFFLKKKNLSQENERFHYSSRFKSKIFASIKVKKFPSSSSIEKAKPWLFLSLSFPLQPWLEDGSRVEKRWKIRYIRSRRRLASGCEFLECRSIQPCGTPFFSFCPFSYFAPPFLAPPPPNSTQTFLDSLFHRLLSLSFSQISTCILPPS